MLIALWPDHWSRSQRSNATLVAALVLMALVLSLLGQLLSFFPEPIGSNAALFADGALTTLYLTLVSGAAGLVLGTGAALARTSRLAWLRWVASIYIWAIRGTPLLVQILFVYFALPVLVPGLNLPDFAAAVVALGLNVGAYNAEALRAGLLAVPRGQTEAARALGLSRTHVFFDVVFPQAFKIALPPTVGYMVQIIKGTSLAAIIGFTEITRAGQIINNATFQPMLVFAVVAALYFVICWPLSLLASRIERRHARALAR